jgi:excisionase family DNA binding protein
MSANEQNDSKTLVYRRGDVCKLLDVSPSTLNRLVDAGKLPAPVISSGRVRRWSRDSIEQVVFGPPVGRE